MTTTDTPTTNYGSWANYTQGSESGPRDVVVNYLGEFAGEFDIDGLTKAFIAAINDRLAGHGITLHANGQFIGPWETRDSLRADTITDAIDAVDLDALAPEFDRN
jgi:hypothetical protein